MPSHESTLGPPGKYDGICASFGPPESTTQTANRSVQPVLQSSRLSLGTLAPPGENENDNKNENDNEND